MVGLSAAGRAFECRHLFAGAERGYFVAKFADKFGSEPGGRMFRIGRGIGEQDHSVPRAFKFIGKCRNLCNIIRNSNASAPDTAEYAQVSGRRKIRAIYATLADLEVNAQKRMMYLWPVQAFRDLHFKGARSKRPDLFGVYIRDPLIAEFENNFIHKTHDGDKKSQVAQVR